MTVLVSATAASVGLGAGCASEEPRAAPPSVTVDDSVVPGYVGSDACASCHEKEFAQWKASLHSRMEQAATSSSVIGDFTEAGTVVAAEAEGKRIVMVKKGDEYWIEAPDANGEQRAWRIDRTIGNRYKQRYLTKFPDGSWHTLPVQWFEKDGKFVEWHHKASVKPGSGDFWADDAWQWQLKCAGCHTTGLDLGWDAATKTYSTRWRELAIGCESCHGPGKEHVLAGGGVGNVDCPSRMTLPQQMDACGKCHSRGTAGPELGAPAGLPGKLAYPYNMRPGSRLDDRFVQVTREKNAAEFWPDGSSKNHHQQLTDHRKSEMYLHGGEKGPTCTTCHDPHDANALKLPIEDNSLCNQCHEDFRDGPSLAQHTGHGADPVANAGARCVECHMPRIVEHAGSQRLRSHTYWGPDAKRSRDTKTPDACLLCHKDKDSAWSETESARIWPSAK